MTCPLRDTVSVGALGIAVLDALSTPATVRHIFVTPSIVSYLLVSLVPVLTVVMSRLQRTRSAPIATTIMRR